MTPQQGSHAVHSLRVNGRRNPLGIAPEAQRLSWSVRCDGGLAAGTTFVVTAAESESALLDGATTWSATTARPWITYDGPPLPARARRAWQVRAASDDETASAIADWEVGLTADADWAATWICGAAERYRHERWDPCPYLRSTFEIDEPVDGPVRLYATALGLYRVWLNGVELTADALFRPGWTDYRTRLLHQTYDAAAALRPGRNVLAVVLAKGWYAGRLGLLRKPAFYGDRPAFLAQLEVDGAVVAATDDSWRTAHGAITASDLLRGESHDLRREPAGWRDADFDDTGWSLAEALTEPPTATIDPQPHDSITVYAEHEGALVHEHARGPLVFDFGQNVVGWTRLTSRFEPSVEAIVRHGEILTPDKLVYRDNLRGAFQEDHYIAADDGPSTVETAFTLHGFRYAEVWGLPSTTDYGPVERHPDTSITAVSVTGLPAVVGTFECSDARLTRLSRNIEWGVRDNFLEAATDCPQRDERHGWLGDAGVIIATAAYYFDVAAFTAKFAQDAADAQGPDGEIPNYVPAVPPSGLLPGAPGWSDGYIRLVHLLVERYGDLTTARRLFPSMLAFVDHVDRHNPDGIRKRAVGANFGDWLSLPEDDDFHPFHTGYEYTGSHSTTPLPIVGTAHTYRSFVQLAEIAGRLGDGDAAARLRARAAEVRAAYLEAFVLADGEIKDATQTAYAQAVGFGLLEGDAATAAADRLRAAIERVGYVTTGIHGTQHVLPVLADHGHAAFANRLLLRDEMPSWLYMVAQGATTIWEKWDAIGPDGDLSTAEMNSFNHYALGAVGRYLFERTGGLDATATTWTGELSVRPNYTRDLAWVTCRYASPVGDFTSAWRWAGDAVEHDIEVPGAAAAAMSVPDGAEARLAGADTVSDGSLHLGPGRHTVIVTGLES